MTRGAAPLAALATLAVVVVAGAVARAETVAIVGATVYERPDKKIDDATIIIRDGLVVEVGRGLSPPAKARRIDGRGKVVTAGLVEGFSQLGMIEVEQEPVGTDGRFGTGPSEIHAAFRATDAFDPRSVALPVARAGGITAVVAAPTGGLVAGQSAWMVLADRVTPPAPVRDPLAVHAAVGAGATASGSRGKALAALRELLDDAAAFERNRAGFERNQSRPLRATRLDLEALVPVLRGQVPLVVRASAEADLRALLRLARERRLRLVIVGGAEAWRVASELAQAKVPVILDPTANLPDLVARDVRDDNAAVLARAGVTVVVSTLGTPTSARTLRQLAGVAVANGLPWATALAAITTAPAEAYGLPGRGTLARGAVADLVVWSGDPLEVTTRAELVFVGGEQQPSVDHQTRLRDRYRRLPAP